MSKNISLSKIKKFKLGYSLKKTTAILGAEEIVKQSVDQDRPNIYGAYIGN